MNKLRHHDIIAYVIYGDYCRLNNKFRERVALNARTTEEYNESLLIEWYLYARDN